MRIITGKARGVRLDTLEGLETRPTSERTKEALFSMLQFEIADSVVLDLFAGSGQMGLEAASRGAKSVVLVDGSKKAVEIIKKNLVKTKLETFCEVRCEEAISYLKRCKYAPFDIVFLDPPYATNLIDEAIRLLLSNDLVKNSSIIVCESDRFDILGVENSQKCDIIKTMKHGVAHITVLRPKNMEEV